jgi:hypothetical protein
MQTSKRMHDEDELRQAVGRFPVWVRIFGHDEDDLSATPDELRQPVGGFPVWVRILGGILLLWLFALAWTLFVDLQWPWGPS